MNGFYKLRFWTSIRNLLISFFTLSAVFTIMTLSALAGEWEGKGLNVKYKKTNGTYAESEWQQIENKWYYFDSDGFIATGWISDQSKYYYIAFYAYSPDTHPSNENYIVSMIYDDSIIYENKEYKFDSTGACILENDKNNGFFWIDGIEYYHKDGVIQTGWFTDGIKMYYAEDNGKVDRSKKFTDKIMVTDDILTDRDLRNLEIHLSDIPNQILSSYFQEHSLYLVFHSELHDYGVTGSFDTLSQDITLYRYFFGIWHEFGHYFDHTMLNQESKTENFHNTADKYLDQFAEYYRSYCKTGEHEYFAEVFDLVITNGGEMKANFPELYYYMINLIQQ